MALEASPLNSYRNSELTLEQLIVSASKLLTCLGLRPDDGRIATAPDVRVIRYYQTVGVLDRPLRYDGRRAIYGFRHLLQLLAVKRLQQEGHPLHLIQQSLAGRPTAALEQALGAMLPSTRPAHQAGTPEPTRAVAPEATAVWTNEPISAPAPTPLIAARLAPGVTITIDPAIVADPDALIVRATAVLAPERPASGRIAPDPEAPDPDAHTNKEH